MVFSTPGDPVLPIGPSTVHWTATSLSYTSIARATKIVPTTFRTQPSTNISKQDDDLPDLAECCDSEDEDDNPPNRTTHSLHNLRYKRKYHYPQVGLIDEDEESELLFLPYTPRI